MGRRFIILIVAVLIAGVGASLVFLYVQGIEQKAQAEAEPVRVLTATATVEAGEKVSDAQAAAKFALTEVPGNAVLSGALTDTDRITDKVALTAIYPGEQLIESKFGEVGSQARITIPDKMLAVSLELGDPQRVAGFVSPGSQVAVFSTSGPPDCTEQRGDVVATDAFTRLLLPEAQVIGVGQTGMSPTEVKNAEGEEVIEEVPTTVLTVALDQADAERTILASQTSCLAFGLLTDSSKVDRTDGTSGAELFEED